MKTFPTLRANIVDMVRVLDRKEGAKALGDALAAALESALDPDEDGLSPSIPRILGGRPRRSSPGEYVRTPKDVASTAWVAVSRGTVQARLFGRYAVPPEVAITVNIDVPLYAKNLPVLIEDRWNAALRTLAEGENALAYLLAKSAVLGDAHVTGSETFTGEAGRRELEERRRLMVEYFWVHPDEVKDPRAGLFEDEEDLSKRERGLVGKYGEAKLVTTRTGYESPLPKDSWFVVAGRGWNYDMTQIRAPYVRQLALVERTIHFEIAEVITLCVPCPKGFVHVFRG